LLVFLLIAIIWVLLKKHSSSWAASSVLLVYVLFAAIGIALELSLVLIIIATMMALIYWDLAEFNQGVSIQENAQSQNSLEHHHLISLFLVVSLSLVLILTGTLIRINIPFGGLVVLSLAAIGGFIFGIQNIVKSL
jgi:hypothetical protein